MNDISPADLNPTLADSFPVTKRNRVRRKHERGRFEQENCL